MKRDRVRGLISSRYQLVQPMWDRELDSTGVQSEMPVVDMTCLHNRTPEKCMQRTTHRQRQNHSSPDCPASMQAIMLEALKGELRGRSPSHWPISVLVPSTQRFCGTSKPRLYWHQRISSGKRSLIAARRAYLV